MREEAWPDADTADELHDALMWLAYLTAGRGRARPGVAGAAGGPARAAPRARPFVHGATRLWIAAERLPLFAGVFPQGTHAPEVVAPRQRRRRWSREAALVEIVRGRLEGSAR